MYAQRFSDGPRFRPFSMGVALAINGGIVAALFLAGPDLVQRIPKPPLTLIDIAPEPEPTDPPPNPHPRLRADQPTPRPTAATTDPQIVDVIDPTEIVTGGGGDVAGTDVVVEPAQPIVITAFVAAEIDPRYAGVMQPDYPDAQRDAGIEGVVRLRVTIGTDGRVRHVDQLDGNPALLRAAARHALARWRFRPATRGGVPEESIKLMSVRFRLHD